MNRSNKAILEAVSKGYKCTKEGKVVSVRNKQVGYLCRQSGYILFSIRTACGYRIKIKAHRLQAYQKFGDTIFDSTIHVRHLNGDRTDFSWDNIAIGSASENRFDIDKEERKRLARNASLKFNHKLVKEFYDSCKSYKKTMEHFSIASKGSLHYILKKTG